MAAKRSKTSIFPKRKPRDIPLPEKLSQATVTPRQLANGNYQRKVQTFFAKPILTKLFNALLRNLDADDPRSVQQAAEIYGVLSGKRGDVNIVMNQQNQTATIGRSAGDDKGYVSFEEIARIVDGERRKRLAAPTGVIDAQFEATPEG